MAQQPAAGTRTGLLAGIRVLDFGIGAVGPDAARHLADFGAEVIKIESLTHVDFMRMVAGPDPTSVNFSWGASNRNKRSLALNLRSQKGSDIVKRLVAISDVIVENNRGDNMESWGLDYSTLKAIKPDIIMLRLPSMGLKGPRRLYATFGPNLPPLCGITHLWSYDSDEPVGSAIIYPDHFAGKIGVCLVMAALLRRRLTGEGQLIEVPQVETAAVGLGPTYLDILVNGRSAQPAPNHRADAAPYGCYPCQYEDSWCAISVSSDEQWQALARVINEPWAQDARFATLLGRLRHRQELDDRLRQWTQQYEALDLMHRLQQAGIPASAAMRAVQQLDDPHIKERDVLVEFDHPGIGHTVNIGIPLKMSRTQPGPFNGAPVLGQDTDEICTRLLNMSPDEIKLLKDEKVLY